MLLNLKIVRNAIAAALLIATSGSVAVAQTIVRADRMLDVESGRILEDVVVVIQDGRIQSVNPSTVPSGDVIDLGNVTLMPGFIDTHVHLTGDLEGDWFNRAVKETAADRDRSLFTLETLRDLDS